LGLRSALKGNKPRRRVREITCGHLIVDHTGLKDTMFAMRYGDILIIHIYIYRVEGKDACK
jgi:hypothetical protein